jgi:hypothetical protein
VDIIWYMLCNIMVSLVFEAVNVRASKNLNVFLN